MNGVLDRIENGIAVILVAEKRDEFSVSEKSLPAGSKEGTWFQLQHHEAGYTIIGINEQKTSESQQKISNLSEKLQARKKQSKFKRK